MLPEVGVPELLVIAAIALIVVGPNDLPILMRKVGRFVAHMRGMAAEFRASFDEMARQSELDELRKEVEAMRAAAQNPAQTAMSHVGLNDIKSDIEQGLYNPHETPQVHVDAEGEPLTEAPPAAAEPAPKPKRRRKAKPKASDAAPETTPSPETGT